MNPAYSPGLPWWLLAVLGLAVVAIAMVLGKLLADRRRRARHLENEEKMAQMADAQHEGAMTRHEGGA